MVIFESLRIGPEKNFCYALICPESGESALFDPAFEAPRVASWWKGLTDGYKNAKVKYLIATHGHRDHAGGFPEMHKLFPEAQIVCHKNDVYRLNAYGLNVDVPLTDGQVLKIGKINLKAIHTPGHTEGGCCYQFEDSILTGDTLFINQCGRTDLPGGDEETLFKSLQRLKNLAKEFNLSSAEFSSLKVFPGHDYGPKPYDTLISQIETNPALQAKTFSAFQKIP